MDVVALSIPVIKLLRPRRFDDPRGWFVETWNRKTFTQAGIDIDFVQDNVSWSKSAGTIRGLHFQRAPHAQAKLVRIAKGRAFDVAVDIRPDSPTFGQHVSAELTAEGGEQLFIPAGFAHGFYTLEPDTEVAYKVSAFYSPEHDAGIRFDDPALGIAWPLGGRPPVISEPGRRDSRSLPKFPAHSRDRKEIEGCHPVGPFHCEGR